MEERGETWAYAAISLDEEAVEGGTVWDNLRETKVSGCDGAMRRDERTSTASEGVRDGSWRRMGANASADMAADVLGGQWVILRNEMEEKERERQHVFAGL